MHLQLFHSYLAHACAGFAFWQVSFMGESTLHNLAFSHQPSSFLRTIPHKDTIFPRPSPIWWMEPLTFSVSYIYYIPSSSPLQLVYWWFLVLLLLYLLFVIKYVVQCYEVSLKSLFRYFLCDYLYICFLWFWVHTCEGACLWRYDVALLFPV